MDKSNMKTITTQIDRGLADSLPHIAMLYGHRSISGWIAAIIEEKVRDVNLDEMARIYHQLKEVQIKTSKGE